MISYKVKRCKCCLEIKPISEFYKRKSVPEWGISRCKKCFVLWDTPNNVLKNKLKYAQSEKGKLKKKEWRLKHKTELNKASNERRTKKRWEGRVRPERIGRKESIRRFYLKNPFKWYIDRYIRMAKVAQATPKWANRETMEAIVKECKRISDETGIKHEVDHIVPLNSKWVSGLNWEGNMRIITREENSKKGNRWWPDMPDIPTLRKSVEKFLNYLRLRELTKGVP